MTTTASALSTIAIASGTPATLDATGLAALTWKLVGQIENIGEFGPTYQVNKQGFLDRNFVDPTKGAGDLGQLTPSIVLDDSDEGQIMMLAALASRNAYWIRIARPDGEGSYHKCLVSKFSENIGDNNSNIKRNTVIDLKPFFNATGVEVSGIAI